MGIKTEDDYVLPFDVRAAMKAYPVTKKNFSVALIKMRYNRMDDKTQQRAEKTLLSLQDGRYWK
tara:strand:- start:1412 stop:1603 length:192 start_codon:yes stop_codon:yes gene_type:complete